MKKFILGIMTIALMTSCSHKWGSTYVAGTSNLQSVKTAKTSASSDSSDSENQKIGGPVTLPQIGSRPVMYLPNATIFRMSGDYANNVAVTLSPNGELSYFPAPSDITADSKPISLGEGWWLNCQGIGPNSVFTNYTFSQYAELPQVPSTQQLKNSIIPGAKVTQFKEIPVKLIEVQRNPDLAKEYIK
ncbi:MAG: hypothetical protein J1F38_06745 [Muribaculaceae bacterium]|nr:hypothetical protein [Muribaculaceae bacterium]